MNKKEYKELRQGFNRRYRALVERSEKLHVELPDKEDLWQKVLESYENGFICEYCGEKMMIKDPVSPHGHSWSIDHKISLYAGGDNSLDNIAIVCTRCNMVKGTMSDKTYREFLECIHSTTPRVCKPDLLDRMFKEWNAGRFANKMDREESLNVRTQKGVPMSKIKKVYGIN